MMDAFWEFLKVVVSAGLGFIAGVVKTRYDFKMKRMEIYDPRKLDSLESYLKYANMCITDKRVYSMLSESSSSLLSYLSGDQYNSVLKATQLIADHRFVEGRNELDNLCRLMQEPKRSFCSYIRKQKKVRNKEQDV